MADIDAFASMLFEEAKAFLEKGRASSDPRVKDAYLHAALNLGFCSFEAHVNAIAEDFLTLSDLSPHERSILSEKRVELEHGRFRITGSLQIYRLEDRLLFLCHRFSDKKPLDRQAVYWSQFMEALDLRNKLTHAKAPPPVTETSVEHALMAILQVLDVTYRRVYNEKYPGRGRGLNSTLEL